MIIDDYVGAVPFETLRQAARRAAEDCGSTSPGAPPRCAYEAALEHLCPCIHNDDCVCRAVAEEIHRLARISAGG